jgi:hypothetical protein
MKHASFLSHYRKKEKYLKLDDPVFSPCEVCKNTVELENIFRVPKQKWGD